MKKLLAITCILLACCGYAVASVGSSVVWNITPAGSTANGAFFDGGVVSPGTNESMGAGTAITCTLASSTTATCSPAITSTTHGPGNGFKFSSGSGCDTTHRFDLQSQSGGTGTFDAAIGTIGDICVGKVGGPTSTIADALTGAVSGNSFNIKVGTYTVTSAIAIAIATNTWSGYSSTPGDLDSTPCTNVLCPVITTATNSTRIIETNQNGGIQTFKNLYFSNTAATRANGICQPSSHGSTQSWIFRNTVWDGFNEAIDSDNGACDDVSNISLILSTVKNDQGAGLASHTGNTYLWGSSFLDDNGAGHGAVYIQGSVTTFTMLHSIIARATNDLCAQIDAATSLIINSAFEKCYQTGLLSTNASAIIHLYNIISYGNGVGGSGYGIDIASTMGANYSAESGNNAVGGNTSGSYHTWVASPGDVTLSTNPFTNDTANNFSLNSTAGGGAACKAAGLPGALPLGGTGYLDIGPLQTQAGAGGASGSMCVQ